MPIGPRERPRNFQFHDTNPKRERGHARYRYDRPHPRLRFGLVCDKNGPRNLSGGRLQFRIADRLGGLVIIAGPGVPVVDDGEAVEYLRVNAVLDVVD